MAKSKARASASTSSSKVRKMTVQGLSVNDILNYEAEIFTDIRFHLAVVFLGSAVLGQVRALTGPKFTASEFTKLESVRTYNKSVLSKSPSMCNVAASVAICRTLIAHSSDSDSNRILADYQDLVTNTSGPSGTSDNVMACLNDPARLRKLRRGYMLQTVGTIQATPVHNHNSLGSDLANLTKENFLDALPFDTSDLDSESIFSELVNLLRSHDETVYQDCITLNGAKDNLAPLEYTLGYKRSLGLTIADLKIPTISDSDPAWKRAAVKAAQNTLKRRS